MEGPGVGSPGSGYCQVVGFYEHSIEPSISKKEWENFEKTEENIVFLNNNCAPWIKSLL